MKGGWYQESRLQWLWGREKWAGAFSKGTLHNTGSALRTLSTGDSVGASYHIGSILPVLRPHPFSGPLLPAAFGARRD